MHEKRRFAKYETPFEFLVEFRFFVFVLNTIVLAQTEQVLKIAKVIFLSPLFHCPCNDVLALLPKVELLFRQLLHCLLQCQLFWMVSKLHKRNKEGSSNSHANSKWDQGQ